jgi:predicted Fe-S protein YdhL (DUF1289 family)
MNSMTEQISIHSPCINVCVISPETGFCQGCYRTVDEISKWMALPAADRVAIIRELERRQKNRVRRKKLI